MGLVAAKCTQCGANIEVDDSKEAGICKFCGTAFITEKAITNYNTYVTNNNNFAGANINVVGGDIDNYLKLANNAIDIANGQEALSYANKALEVNIECSEAWIIKMKAVSLSATAGDPKFLELFTCGNNAIKFAADDKREEIEFKVNEFYLDFSHTLMLTAISLVSDTSNVSRLFQAAGFNLASISAVQQGDAKVRETFEQVANNAINLKSTIDVKYIEEYEEFQQKVKKLAELYIEYCKADQARTKIYGLTPENCNPEATVIRRKNLSLITKGLKDENNVNEAEIDHSKSGSGCYIATCVYGSYDCPQVWTLRRFRDYTLDETWYGRLFIKCYYAISPTLVKWFGETKWFRRFWKSKLDKMVDNLNSKGIENTRYKDKH